MQREIGRVMAISITCKDCGKVFVMGNKEVSWYTQKMEYLIPKRCPMCRKRRKERMEEKKGIKIKNINIER